MNVSMHNSIGPIKVKVEYCVGEDSNHNKFDLWTVKLIQDGSHLDIYFRDYEKAIDLFGVALAELIKIRRPG